MLAPAIARYVALKRALGRGFGTQGYVLGQLDRFLCARRLWDLTPTTFAAWCSSLERLAPSGRRQQLRLVYHFCLYRRRTEPTCFVPDPSQFPRPHPRPRPHIFSTEDITRLLRVADGLLPNAPSPLHGQVARLAIVLLYTTGLRRGELVRLTLGDYDSGEHVLLVRETKFHKSRLVPLSADATNEIERYLRDRMRLGLPREAAAPLLLTRHGGLTGYSDGGLGRLIRRVFRAAGARTAADRTPRMHDLRFTFAVHALLRWYRAGVDVQARLPALSAYMGHGSIASTEYYLPFVDAIAEAASERFGRHCSGFLPSASTRRGGR